MEDYPLGFHSEDWMDLPREEGTDVISPPRVTNFPPPASVMKIKVGEEDSAILEVSQLDHVIEAQLVASVSVLTQPTYLLPSAISSRLVGNDLTRIRTFFSIPDEYQMRISSPKEREKWRSPGWVCFYEVAFINGFRFPFLKLIT